MGFGGRGMGMMMMVRMKRENERTDWRCIGRVLLGGPLV